MPTRPEVNRVFQADNHDGIADPVDPLPVMKPLNWKAGGDLPPGRVKGILSETASMVVSGLPQRARTPAGSPERSEGTDIIHNPVPDLRSYIRSLQFEWNRYGNP